MSINNTPKMTVINTGFGYSEATDGTVNLRITHDDYNYLIMGLGCLAATIGSDVLEVANRINEGNPQWTSYETSDKIKKMAAVIKESKKK